MESGAISDRQIKASSQWDAKHASFQGRLNFQETLSKAGSWSAGTNDVNQWLQVDLGNQHTKVTRVATQGRNDDSEWVTKYKLQYSYDGIDFQYYREQGKRVNKVRKVFYTETLKKRKLFGILLNIYKSLNIRSFKKIALLPVGQRQIARHSEAKAECYRT